MDSSSMERKYKSWIISLMVVTLLLAIVSVSLLSVLLLQNEKTDFFEHNEVTHSRKARGLFKQVVNKIESIFGKSEDEEVDGETCIIKQEDDPDVKFPVCITKDCTETASTLLSAMDRSVNPCADFYKFACGGYIKKNPVATNQLSISTSLTYYSYYQLLMKRLIEETDYTKEPEVVFKMQEAYHVCLNTSYQPYEELEGFKRYIQKELGGWPKLDNEIDTANHSIEEFMGKLFRKGYDLPFLKISMEADIYVNPRKSIITISKEFKPTLPVDVTEGEHGPICKVNSSINILERIAQTIGFNKSCFQNPIAISNINMEQAMLQLQDKSDFEDITIKDLIQATAESKFDWLLLLNTVFENFHTFKEDDRIYVTSLNYLKQAASALKKFNFRDISQYMHDVIVQDIVIHGGPLLDKYYFEFMSSLGHPQAIPAREAVCLEWIVDKYAIVLTRLVVQQLMDHRTKEVATKLIDLIIKSYENTIRDSEWIDDKTKERAIKKARSMSKQVAYPEYAVKDEELDKVYKKLTHVYPTHVENFVAIQHYDTHEGLNKINAVYDPSKDWLATPLTINAGYSPEMNTAVLQLGMLSLPYFDVNRVSAVNYGMLGSIIGHEIGHGFDTSGRLYDEIGRKTQWWTEETETEYLKLANCFINQYSNYCPEELIGENICVNGNQTVGENIADNSGLKAAFQAYQEYVKEFGEEKRLPGLQEYTPNQIFFISFAYGWCENIPPYNWLSRYADDEHSPGQYRVLGALSNSEEFAESFQCPPGPMNRGKDRCTLW